MLLHKNKKKQKKAPQYGWLVMGFVRFTLFASECLYMTEWL